MIEIANLRDKGITQLMHAKPTYISNFLRSLKKKNKKKNDFGNYPIWLTYYLYSTRNNTIFEIIYAIHLETTKLGKFRSL